MGLGAREVFKSSIYMELATVISKLSKDPNTKVGAVIVKEGKILGIGYNGAPKLFPDEKVPQTHNNELFLDKNTYMLHAEVNAILNSNGDLSNSTIFITHYPCYECAKILCQSGIEKVIYINEYKKEITDISNYIFKECGIKCYQLDEYLKEVNGDDFKD